MANEADLNFLKRRIAELEDLSLELPVKSGGGRGTSDGMESRVAMLEAMVDPIQSDMSDISSDVREFRGTIGSLNSTVAGLTERVAHLPSKRFIVGVGLSTFALIAAVIFLQGNLQRGLDFGWLHPVTVTKSP